MAGHGGEPPQKIDKDFAAALVAMVEAFKRGEQKQAETAKKSVLAGFIKTWLLPVFPSIITFALGYTFIQSVEQDLQRAGLQAENAEKVREYVEKLWGYEGPGERPSAEEESGQAPADIHAVGIALGGYGRFAIHPLIMVHEYGYAQDSPLKSFAAASGIEQAGRVDAEIVCDALTAIISDETKAYEWETLRMAVNVVGRLECEEKWSRPLFKLRLLKSRLGDGEHFKQTLKGDPNDRNVTSIADDVDVAIKRLQF